jgi:integrase
MDSAPRLPTGSLLVRQGPSGTPFYEAKWRHEGAQVYRRVGRAWVVPDPDREGEWKPRRGRVPEECYDEKRAIVRMAEIIHAHAEELANEARTNEEEQSRLPTFRQVGLDWLRWHDELSGATPKTRDDYRYMLAEPGTPWKRGKGTYAGLIMEEFGDRAAADIVTDDFKTFFAKLDRAGKKPRNVNKHRIVLHSIYNWAIKQKTYGVTANPVTDCEMRREKPPKPLDFFEPAEVERLAQAAAAGLHRTAQKGRGGAPIGRSNEEIAARRAEDQQDAELFRVLAFTGMRIGEALAYRVSDIDRPNRRLVVHRAVSGTEEVSPKDGEFRYVVMATVVYEAFCRVLDREDFTGRDDYVFCNRLGGRQSYSAVRRRWHKAREAAGLRYMKLHGLRHGAGSMAARESDIVFVKEMLGHSKLSTTERYMHSKPRPEDVRRLDRAFGSGEAVAAA